MRFFADAKPPRAEINFGAFDRAMAAAIETYHFTGFSVPIEGMGGGTFFERSEPSLGRFGEQTPEYQAMFASQVRQIEEHFRQKGWLDMAYVYWFDEPDVKDYPFVRNGMVRLKKYAPGLSRMLTKEPSEGMAGAVDIWCCLTPAFHPEAASKRRAQGERFWWYVCCGPSALLYGVHRPSGYRTSGVALADVAAGSGGYAGLGNELLDFGGRLSRKSRRTPTKTR